MTSSSLKLRGHHLLCSLTYKGLGYNESFIENFDKIMVRLNRGDTIELVKGIDAVCGALHQEGKSCTPDGDHCNLPRSEERDRLALEAVSKVLKWPLKIGDRFVLLPKLIASLRRAFEKGSIRAACERCEWHETCTKIASSGYAGAKLTGQNNSF